MPPRQRLPTGPGLSGRGSRRGPRPAGGRPVPSGGVDIPADPGLDTADALALLSIGDLEIAGRITGSSNATFLTTVSGDGVRSACVYKPVRGERPLWDFPEGTLAGRELATFAVSEAAGWGVVPPTVLREGPFGEGMVQQWVHADGPDLVDVVPAGAAPDGWLPVLEATDGGGGEVVVVHADDASLRVLALLDVVVNNADRKGGHVLSGGGGAAVRGCDHGLTFNVEDKLRTVLWGFAGRRLTAEEDAALAALGDRIGSRSDPLTRLLGDLLTRGEVATTADRISGLRRERRLPSRGGRWPAVPWPVF